MHEHCIICREVEKSSEIEQHASECAGFAETAVQAKAIICVWIFMIVHIAVLCSTVAVGSLL